MLLLLTCALTRLPSCALLSAELSETQCADLSLLHHRYSNSQCSAVTCTHLGDRFGMTIVAAAAHV